ncbi:MAG TPA: hypothetical protein VGQ10_04450 [Vicinamibacterales bacterium]|nr:hypothetical protein [Vicinamibacterales bacterium]
MMTYLISGLIVLGVALLTVLWLQLQQQRAIDRLDDRLAHLTAGISLLTDTTESGLRDVAQEIGRLAASSLDKPRVRAARQRRIATAARRGRSVEDIAVTEQVSEGEVRLRLQLADSPRYERAHDASVR